MSHVMNWLKLDTLLNKCETNDGVISSTKVIVYSQDR